MNIPGKYQMEELIQDTSHHVLEGYLPHFCQRLQYYLRLLDCFLLEVDEGQLELG
jgi:hypothetical protein